MAYIVLNYGLNKTFNIHKYVFFQVVKSTLKNIPGFYVTEEIEINLVEENTNIEIFLTFQLKQDLNLEETINKVQDQINEQVKSLIGVSPKNIQLNYQGRK